MSLKSKISKAIAVYKMAYNREVKMYESVVEHDQVHKYVC